jgi:Putative DNA-binding domain
MNHNTIFIITINIIFTELINSPAEKRFDVLKKIIAILEKQGRSGVIQIEESYSSLLQQLYPKHKEEVASILSLCVKFFNFKDIKTYIPKLKKLQEELLPELEILEPEKQMKSDSFMKNWLQIKNLRDLIDDPNESISVKVSKLSSYLGISGDGCNLFEIRFLEPYIFNLRAWMFMTRSMILAQFSDLPLKQRTSFFRGEKLIYEESYTVEYKKYPIPFTDPLFEKVISSTICSFLNRRGGRIYIGVEDGSKMIHGLVVPSSKMAEYTRYLKDLAIKILNVREIDELIQVMFVPVKNENTFEIIPDLYVVKMIIKQGNPTKLYCFKDRFLECYIRNNGFKSTLSSEQIYSEMSKRKNNPNLDVVASEEFKDPEPEKY